MGGARGGGGVWGGRGRGVYHERNNSDRLTSHGVQRTQQGETPVYILHEMTGLV